MATTEQRTEFRRRIGDNNSSAEVFTDPEIDDLYTEAAQTYSTALLIGYYAVVLGLEWLLADAAKLTTYKQNNSTENQSDIFKHLKQLLDLWEGKVEKAARRATSGVKMSRFGPHRVNDKRLPKSSSWGDS